MTEEIRVLMHVAETVAREAAELVRRGGRVRSPSPRRSRARRTWSPPWTSRPRRCCAGGWPSCGPDDGILGEEDALTPSSSGTWWVVDPIDGTVNYLYGLPAYAVSVAAVISPDGTDPDPATWTVLAGCVVAPRDGRVFLAGLGRGATLDGRPLRVNDAQPLIDCLVGHGLRVRGLSASVPGPRGGRAAAPGT